MDPLPRGLLGLQRRYLFTLYLLIGSLLIVAAVTAYTLRIVRAVEDQSRLTTELFSGVASRLLLTGDLNEAQKLYRIIREIDVPFIITDNAGRPIVWNPRIGIAVVEDVGLLLSQDPRHPLLPEVRRVLEIAAAYDAENEPFAVHRPDGSRLGTLHYGESALSQQIQIMPYLELAIMALFFLVLLWGLQVKKENDQNLLFAGMAKETAHQLGTPLTSILGWLALLQERSQGSSDSVVTELGRDVERLGKVSARFSQIGSLPKLDDQDLMAVVEDTIVYFRRRLPHLGGRVALHSEGAVRNPVSFNRDLMEWVLENLIKNGIDALKDGKGTVTIRVADMPEGGVIIRVVDTGGGIPSRYRPKVFDPGFTTKKRGWGMGLALVKRIVTQYHGGRIRVETTGPRGTTFAITLPAGEI
jgi:signal transduction histidine kinase